MIGRTRLEAKDFITWKELESDAKGKAGSMTHSLASLDSEAVGR